MEIEVSLEPLYKLKIVLVLALAELLNIDVFLYFALREGLLEDLIVIDELPFIAGMPIDPLHCYFSRKHGIYYVAVDCTATQLLDLCHLETQGGIYPVQEVAFRHEESSLHHANALLLRTHQK